jgi:hypothetical protein
MNFKYFKYFKSSEIKINLGLKIYSFLLLSIYFTLCVESATSKRVYDSYLNMYKDNALNAHSWNDIANTTWKEFFVSENVTNLIKSLPVYIDDDRDLDLLVLDSETRLYWVSNIRGTSKEIKHKFISKNKLQDFVVSLSKGNKVNQKDYILGINSKRNLIFKYMKSSLNSMNSMNSLNSLNMTLHWEETVFLDINNLPAIGSMLENNQIQTLHLSQYADDYENETRQILLVSLTNVFDETTTLLKIIIKNQEAYDISTIKFKSSVKIIGSFDMNLDGLIDILYIDSQDNLHVMINDDPYYLHVFIASVNTVTQRGIPRIFILDSDRDGFPDILSADKTQNIVGILFNNGKSFWEEVGDYFKNSLNRNKVFSKEQWKFVPLFDYYEQNLKGELKDFDVFPTTSNKRINFEIFAIYGNNLYWFVENDLDVPKDFDWGNHQTLQNYMYCMKKCDIVLETSNSVFDYKFILDIDINVDGYPEFIIYSGEETTLYWIKKYVPYLSGIGWDSNFWIYMILYIYVVSSVVGLFEFYRLKKLNDQVSLEKLLKSGMKTTKSEGNLLPDEVNY